MDRDIYHELGTLRALADIGARTIAELLDEDASEFRAQWNRDGAKTSLKFIQAELAKLDAQKEVDTAAG